jgi:hypothetical protein
VRERLIPIAKQFGATIQVAELPPGPPVLQTLVAEVYGPDPARRTAVAAQVKSIFDQTPGVVDTDWYLEAACEGHACRRWRKGRGAVTYVTGDLAGKDGSPVYAILRMNKRIGQLSLPEGYGLEVFNAVQPFETSRCAMKWDGEWQLTIEMFRGLGLAFAAVLVLIYPLVVGWFQSFKTPLLIMAAIPFSLVGILPAQAAMGAYFIELRLREGLPLEQAVPVLYYMAKRHERTEPHTDASKEARPAVLWSQDFRRCCAHCGPVGRRHDLQGPTSFASVFPPVLSVPSEWSP